MSAVVVNVNVLPPKTIENEVAAPTCSCKPIPHPKKLPNSAKVQVCIAKDGLVGLVHFEFAGLLSTDDLPALEEIAKSIPKYLRGVDVVIVSGRMPIWAAVNVAHAIMHLYKALALYDPKLGGGVVAVTHHPAYPVGKVIPLTACLQQALSNVPTP
jgi:CRISPR-associated protein Csx3